MDDRRVGRLLRAIRHRLGRRQEDVGADAGVSQDVVSRAERGQLAPLTIGRLRAIATTLDADLIISLRWHGVELDRLLDEGHATLGGRVVQLLDAAGWDVRPEVSYSVFGERGSIDLLAWHLQTRTLLVIEIKTELASLETTIRKLDEKVRLAPRIGDERFDWQPRAVSYLLVITATSTPRRQVQRHAAVMDKVFPVRGGALRKWLAAPSGTIGGLMLVSLTRPERGRAGHVSRKRIRLTVGEKG